MTATPSADWAVIFDWDGVLADSIEQHRRSWELLSQETGQPLPPGYFQLSLGMKSTKVITDLLAWTQDPARAEALAARKSELYRQVCEQEGVRLHAGAKELISALRTAGVPCGVGTGSTHRSIDFALQRFGIADWFGAVVTANDVVDGKPDPEVFLTAAARLGALPTRCVVIEDAVAGVAAAKAGGMKAVAVLTTNSRENLAAADLIVERLERLSVPMLRDVVNAL